MINRKYTNQFNQQFECLKSAFVELNMAIDQDDSLTHFVEARIFHLYDYALEFSIKIMQSYLAIQGDFEAEARLIVSKATRVDLIENAEIWYKMLDDSSSNKDIFDSEDYARVRFLIINEYAPQIKALIECL